MNTFLRIIVLAITIALFYFLSDKMTKAKHNIDNKKYDYKDVIYYVMSVIAIISIISFSFPTYIPLSWNKIVVLIMVLLALLVAYFVYYFTAEEYTSMYVPIVATFAILAFSTYFPITGKQQFEEPLTEVNSYPIVISTNEEDEFAVQKLVDGNEQYYVFTYLDENQNPIDVKTTDIESDIIVDSSKKNFATCKVEEKVFVYEHSEITDKGENLTFEEQVKYNVNVSKDLYFDTTKKE